MPLIAALALALITRRENVEKKNCFVSRDNDDDLRWIIAITCIIDDLLRRFWSSHDTEPKQLLIASHNMAAASTARKFPFRP